MAKGRIGKVNNDLDEIVDLLQKRFPRCEVKIMRSGEYGPNPLVTVFFPSCGDEVFAVGDVPGKGKMVHMGVSQHAKLDDFKPSGYDLFKFKYKGPEYLVEKFVEGSKKMYDKLKEFEDFEDKCDKDWGINERNPLDHRLAPELAAEINVGSPDALVVEWERDTM